MGLEVPGAPAPEGNSQIGGHPLHAGASSVSLDQLDESYDSVDGYGFAQGAGARGAAGLGYPRMQPSGQSSVESSPEQSQSRSHIRSFQSVSSSGGIGSGRKRLSPMGGRERVVDYGGLEDFGSSPDYGRGGVGGGHVSPPSSNRRGSGLGAAGVSPDISPDPGASGGRRHGHGQGQGGRLSAYDRSLSDDDGVGFGGFAPPVHLSAPSRAPLTTSPQQRTSPPASPVGGGRRQMVTGSPVSYPNSVYHSVSGSPQTVRGGGREPATTQGRAPGLFDFEDEDTLMLSDSAPLGAARLNAGAGPAATEVKHTSGSDGWAKQGRAQPVDLASDEDEDEDDFLDQLLGGGGMTTKGRSPSPADHMVRNRDSDRNLADDDDDDDDDDIINLRRTRPTASTSENARSLPSRDADAGGGNANNSSTNSMLSIPNLSAMSLRMTSKPPAGVGLGLDDLSPSDDARHGGSNSQLHGQHSYDNRFGHSSGHSHSMTDGDVELDLSSSMDTGLDGSGGQAHTSPGDSLAAQALSPPAPTGMGAAKFNKSLNITPVLAGPRAHGAGGTGMSDSRSLSLGASGNGNASALGASSSVEMSIPWDDVDEDDDSPLPTQHPKQLSTSAYEPAPAAVPDVVSRQAQPKPKPKPNMFSMTAIESASFEDSIQSHAGDGRSEHSQSQNLEHSPGRFQGAAGDAFNTTANLNRSALRALDEEDNEDNEEEDARPRAPTGSAGDAEEEELVEIELSPTRGPSAGGTVQGAAPKPAAKPAAASGASSRSSTPIEQVTSALYNSLAFMRGRGRSRSGSDAGSDAGSDVGSDAGSVGDVVPFARADSTSPRPVESAGAPEPKRRPSLTKIASWLSGSSVKLDAPSPGQRRSVSGGEPEQTRATGKGIATDVSFIVEPDEEPEGSAPGGSDSDSGSGSLMRSVETLEVPARAPTATPTRVVRVPSASTSAPMQPPCASGGSMAPPQAAPKPNSKPVSAPACAPKPVIVLAAADPPVPVLPVQPQTQQQPAEQPFATNFVMPEPLPQAALKGVTTQSEDPASAAPAPAPAPAPGPTLAQLQGMGVGSLRNYLRGETVVCPASLSRGGRETSTGTGAGQISCPETPPEDPLCAAVARAAAACRICDALVQSAACAKDGAGISSDVDDAAHAGSGSGSGSSQAPEAVTGSDLTRSLRASFEKIVHAEEAGGEGGDVAAGADGVVYMNVYTARGGGGGRGKLRQWDSYYSYRQPYTRPLEDITNQHAEHYRRRMKAEAAEKEQKEEDEEEEELATPIVAEAESLYSAFSIMAARLKLDAATASSFDRRRGILCSGPIEKKSASTGMFKHYYAVLRYHAGRADVAATEAWAADKGTGSGGACRPPPGLQLQWLLYHSSVHARYGEVPADLCMVAAVGGAGADGVDVSCILSVSTDPHPVKHGREMSITFNARQLVSDAPLDASAGPGATGPGVVRLVKVSVFRCLSSVARLRWVNSINAALNYRDEISPLSLPLPPPGEFPSTGSGSVAEAGTGTSGFTSAMANANANATATGLVQ